MATQVRDAEVTKAQNNPTTISPLVGAPSQAQTQAPAQPQAQAGGGDIMQQLSNAQGQIQGMSDKLYGSGFVSGGETQKEGLMQELFNYDKALEGQLANPPQQQPGDWLGYVPDPGQTASYLSNLGGQAAANVGTTIGAVDVAERSYQSAMSAVMDKLVSYVQMQEDRKNKEEERAWEREKFEYQKEQDALDRAKGTGGSFTERLFGQQTLAFQDIAQMAQAGVELKDIMRKYSTDPNLGPEDILRIYNTNSIYGPAVESAQELQRSYGVESDAASVNTEAVAAYANRVQSGEINLTNVPTSQRDAVVVALADMPITDEQRQTYNFIIDGLRDYRKKIEGISFFGAWNPTAVQKGEIDAARDILVMQIARLYEKGRMSDKDREYYQNLIPSGERAWTTPDYALGKVDQVMATLESRYGSEMGGGGQVMMISPDGQEYMVSNDETAEAEANGWRRL